MPAKSYCSIRNILSFCIKTITLRVCLTQGQDIDHYIVEYYRDQWQLWLRYLDTHNLKLNFFLLLPKTSLLSHFRMKTCLDTNTVITDLIPGSKVHIIMFNENNIICQLFCFENIKHAVQHSFLVFQYKFRVMSASIAGISEASPESEEVK